MWTYSQRRGVLCHNGEIIGIGYAGHGDGKNNPALQNVHEAGPLPQGKYTIGKPFDSPTHGPHCMPLTPDPSNEMFGRAGFLMHADAIAHPGGASAGCIVMPPAVRHLVSASGDTQLTVVTD